MPWLAALTYALTTVLIAIAWAFGGLPAQTALEVVGAYRAINLALYATFRSGFNLRFRDPSLTRPQILIAITAIMYIVYQESETLLKAADAAMYTAKPT